MKTIHTLPIILSAFVLTGCFAPYKKTKALHEVEKFYPSGELAHREKWLDVTKGGGPALFVDPKVTQINSENVNQNALGGGSKLKVGEVTGTNRPDMMDATGNAGGKLIRAGSGMPDLGAIGKDIPGKPTVIIGDTVYTREPDIYGLDGKLFRFDVEKRTMTPIP